MNRARSISTFPHRRAHKTTTLTLTTQNKLEKPKNQNPKHSRSTFQSHLSMGVPRGHSEGNPKDEGALEEKGSPTAALLAGRWGKGTAG